MQSPYRDVVPVGATSVRPSWTDLPVAVRAAVAEREGAEVTGAREHRTGYTPGYAATVTLADGRTVFVKAADEATRGMFAEAYRAETQVVRRLPALLPVPRVRWATDVAGWYVVAFEHVDGRAPYRRWTADDLAGALGLAVGLADLLGPPVPGVLRFDEEFGFLPALWDEVEEPRVHRRRDEARALAEVGLEVGATGDVLCHTDLRDDNLLVDRSGRWWLCDWNGLCTGPRLFDALVVLVSAHGDGHDADALLAAHRRAGDPDDEAFDGLLALVAGYFWQRCALEHLPTSPHLRAHQRWYAEAAWSWLTARRGW